MLQFCHGLLSDLLSINVDTHATTVFLLACCVGYYVVWKVTPALHAPLMAVTNAISSVIIIGAIFGFLRAESDVAKCVALIALLLLSVNIFGGFMLTRRMLSMFRKR